MPIRVKLKLLTNIIGSKKRWTELNLKNQKAIVDRYTKISIKRAAKKFRK